MPDAARTVVPLRAPERATEPDPAVRIERLERELAAVRGELAAAEAALDGAEAGHRSTVDALRRVNAELRVMFEEVPVGIVLCAADGTVVAANGLAHEWAGLPDSALLGAPYHRYVPRECRERVRGADARAMADGTATTSDVHRLAVPGRDPMWLRTTRVPFRHADTGEPMLLLMSEDRTASHEQELRTEYFRSRMELALGASDIGMWDRFLDSGEAFWCDRLKAIMGVPAAFEPRPGGFLERVHPDDVAEVERVEIEHLASGEPFTLRARIVRPDGEMRWVTRSGRMYERDGAPERMTGTVVDDTELVSRLERTQALNQHLRLAERLSSTGYWSLALDGTDRGYWSDQVWAIHGLERGAGVEGVEDALSRYHPEDADRVRARLAATVETGAKLEFHARIVRPDGEIRHVSVLGVVQGEGDDRRTLFGVMADVTSMTERERSLREAHDALARSNEELSRFGYVCSHDMKEPVRTIESMSRLLLTGGEDQDPVQGRELLERIHANTSRLRAIIDSLLAYSRVEARIESVEVDLAQVAREVRDNLGGRIAERRATLEIAELPAARGARVHFAQLLQNLVGNALTYSDRDAPRVRIRGERSGGAVTLVVDDDGPGVPEAERERIFEVFTRLEIGTAEGTGLGLSICKRIVQQYGGRMECAVGGLGGAEFRIVLPEDPR